MEDASSEVLPPKLPRGSWKRIGRLVGELKPYRRRLIMGTLCLLLATPATLFPNFLWMFVVDTVLANERMDLLLPALLLGLAVYAVGLVLGVIRDRAYERAGLEFTHDLRLRLHDKLSGQSADWMNEQRTGDLQSRVIGDVDAVQSSLINGFISFVEELYTFILVLVAICFISPAVGAAVFVPLFAAYFVARHFNPRMRALYRATRAALGRLGAQLQEALSGFLVMKSFANEEREHQAFAEKADEVLDRGMAAVRLRTTMFPILFSFAYLTNIIMLGLGALLVTMGSFTIGGLVALRGFWWQLNSPVRTLARINDLLQRALASSGRIYEILDAPVQVEDHPNAKPVTNPRQPLAMVGVSFAYRTGHPILHHVNLRIDPGEIIGLAGSSGAGKSTLLSLLSRFYDPTQGRVMLGSDDLRKLTQRSYRQHIALVLQDTFLFYASVAENIAYGRPNASPEEIQGAAEQANAAGFIENLPDGYATLVGERGVKLSGGQRQRIGVARAFLTNPEILFLDEPTSSVEPESERIIQDSILDLMKGRTVVLSSHRPSLLRQAHRILFLAEGIIQEEGSHFELLERGGKYAEAMQQWSQEEPAWAIASGHGSSELSSR
ncbi:MAG: ABC transporter ATP-binding protein [Verrucomicrobiales bacterium]